jgi:hypothetical protein
MIQAGKKIQPIIEPEICEYFISVAARFLFYYNLATNRSVDFITACKLRCKYLHTGYGNSNLSRELHLL